jgi:hypothetical protein
MDEESGTTTRGGKDINEVSEKKTYCIQLQIHQEHDFCQWLQKNKNAIPQ